MVLWQQAIMPIYRAIMSQLNPQIQYMRAHWGELKPLLEAIGYVLLVVVGVALAAVVLGIVGVVSMVINMITWIERAVQWFGNLAGAARNAAGDIIGAFRNITGNPIVGAVLHTIGVPGFAEGGTVPGAEGAPMLAVVHGGEQISTRAQQGRGAPAEIHIHIDQGAYIDGPSIDRLSLAIARRLSYATGR
jgi:hypothetical protein